MNSTAGQFAISRPASGRELRYRPDIDGMRAIAVLSVLFYHFRIPPFSGGFVGVDVFFVISGYLITALIRKEMGEDDFSLLQFYERRVRRILPALFALLAGATIAASFLLFPDDFKRYAKTALATIFFGSNFQLWSVTGYFDVAAIQKPLLHTWSLAVEEQFYLIYPLVLLGLRRTGRRNALIVIGAILALSLGLSIWGVREAPDAAFYLAPFRFWELMIGAVLAIGRFALWRNRLVREAIAFAGLALVAIAVFTFSGATLFPGESALLPCLGTALMIYAGADERVIVNRMLSWRPVVFIGLISYSLYLWHWPVYVFVHYYLYRDLTPLETAGCVAASFALAILSWRFVERPFRKRQGRNAIPRHVVFRAAVSAAAVLAMTTGGVMASDGVPGRFRPAIHKILAERYDTDGLLRYCFARPLTEVNTHDLCQFGARGDVTPSFILWGDSHADAILPAVEDVAQRHGLRGYFAGEPSCAPLLGVSRPDTPHCKAFNDKVLKIALKPGIQTVILMARWGKNADGRAYGDEGHGFVPISDDAATAKSPAGNAAIFTRGLKRTVDALLAAHKQVVLVGPVPEVGWPVPQVLARIRLSHNMKKVYVPLADYRKRQRIVLPLFARLDKRQGVRTVYPSHYLCTDGRCKVAIDGVPLYRDEHHLSVYGAEKLVPLFSGIFGNPSRG